MALLEHIILNENAYFYKKREGFTLSTARVERIFAEVSAERVGHYTLKIVKKAEALGTYSAYYSICIFKFNKTPTFLDEDIEDVYETKYGYLVLIEYSDFIVIIRKHISDLSLLSDLEQLDYMTISRVYVSDQTRFERLSMKNMDIANSAVRNKTIEANDVKESMSNLGASKYIVNNMRVTDPEGTKSLSFNTSRISDLDRKVKIIPLLNWVIQVVNRAKAFTSISSFMDVFAMPVDFESYVSELVPASILFSITDIKYDIENGKIDKVSFSHLKDEREIPLGQFVKYLNKFSTYNELELHPIADNTYRVLNTLDSTLSVKLNTKSITIGSAKLKGILFHIGDSQINLIQYLNQKNNFIITFDKIELIYFSRKLFKDSKLLASIDSFLTAFKTTASLQHSTSEKGNIGPASTFFDPTSVFGIIEDEIANTSEYLFCDDLGTEWADYISIQNDSINFYHAKSNSELTHGISASKFQDVVGQALKNLGNIIPADHQWPSRIAKWESPYSTTAINRLRIGDSVANGVAKYKELVFKPNVRKKIHLVVDFISKANIASEFHRLMNGEQVARKNELIQILWFISSLISTCTELGYEVYIVCQP